MKLSIVIPNYNGKELLEKNLPEVLKAAENYNGEIEIIVVDDGSTDGSLEKIKNQSASWRTKIKNTKQKLKILENKRNLGFASAVNQGVKEASGEIVVLLNTDVVPEKDFLRPLVSHFNDPRVFAVGCLDKSLENGKIVLRGRGVGKWQRGFLVHSRGKVDKTDTLWVSCGSGAFRKSLWLKLGWLDEIYNPFYWEDIDLSYRALKSGYKIMFEPKSVVIHEHQKGSIRKKYSPLQIKTIAYRNQFFFVWKNITDFTLLFSHFLFLPFHFLKAIIRKDFSFYFGFWKALVNLPKVTYERKRVRRMFIKKDKEVRLP